VELASSAGRPVVAHASTPEGMRRAVLAGVQTIEHGDGGTAEIFQLMKEHGVALCPTIAAGYAISIYRGWDEQEPLPERVKQKKESFQLALKEGVTIVAGGDVGVFSHGQNVWELELMAAYGMPPLEVLRSATSVNARVFGIDEKVGRVAKGMLADLLIVTGNPAKDISSLRQVKYVFKDGQIVKATFTR
jgi:imidazolonepropionase-like amidohydrolase